MAKPRCIFVYGTLKSAARGALGFGPRARLAAESRYLAPATVVGMLYDLGSYPGLVLPASPECLSLRRGTNAEAMTVHGEVFELSDPARSLVWLDRYEGIAPGNPYSEYKRVVRNATIYDQGPSASTIEAWVYVYQGSLNRARKLPGGKWRS